MSKIIKRGDEARKALESGVNQRLDDIRLVTARADPQRQH